MALVLLNRQFLPFVSVIGNGLDHIGIQRENGISGAGQVTKKESAPQTFECEI